MNVKTFVINSDNSTKAEAGLAFGPAMLKFVTDVVESNQPPLVLSISLGSLGWDACDLLCQTAAKDNVSTYADCFDYSSGLFQVCMFAHKELTARINVEFIRAGLRGTTVVGAAGDGGNHFSFGAFPFRDTLGRQLNQIACNLSLPTFPSESPWVLSVGGVQMKQNTSGNFFPIGCSSQTGGEITGGCGFSIQFDRKSFQNETVINYLNQSVSLTDFPLPGSFNQNGRAYPDLSAISSDVPIVINGKEVASAGTSASTPVIAGLISLINDARLNQNLPPLGFFSPLLYSSSAVELVAMFIDVTSGNSRCGTDICCSTGFQAAQGWDAFTGFGSPLFPALLSHFTSDPKTSEIKH